LLSQGHNLVRNFIFRFLRRLGFFWPNECVQVFLFIVWNWWSLINAVGFACPSLPQLQQLGLVGGGCLLDQLRERLHVDPRWPFNQPLTVPDSWVMSLPGWSCQRAFYSQNRLCTPDWGGTRLCPFVPALFSAVPNGCVSPCFAMGGTPFVLVLPGSR